MKKNSFLLLLIFTVFVFQTHAQDPGLPIKANLNTSLSGIKTFTNSSNVDVIVLPLSNKNEFTLEVNAQINEAAGRGLDVEFTNDFGTGLRTSLDKTSFNSTSLLSAIENLSSTVNNAQEQTYRYAVKDGVAHIYQDGHYISSKPLIALEGGTETTPVLNYGTDNFLATWAGVASNNSGRPTDYGWVNPSVTFNTANAGSGVRYMDVTSGHTFENGGAVYQGRLMYMRWDGNSYSTSTYSFPVNLEKGYQYEFSWIYEYIANAASGAKMNVAISSNVDGSNPIESKTFISGTSYKLKEGALSFVSQTEGIHYLTITGDWALFGIGELNLKSTNQINNWDGLVDNHSGSPNTYGWSNTYGSLPWGVSNSGLGIRYTDVTSGHTYESDNSNFVGRLLYVGWDSVAYETSTYSFPVDLIADKGYKFSWIYELLSGATSGAEINVAISASQDGTNPIETKSFTTGNVNSLREGELLFSPITDGTYYITLTGDAALFGIGKLGVKEFVPSKIVIGKNYINGIVDMVVNSVTYEDLAYAPAEVNAPSLEVLDISSDIYANVYAKSKLELNGAASFYLNNAFNPLVNSTVDIMSSNARLYFEHVKPSVVMSSFLNLITVNGVQAQNDVNVVISNFGTGTVILPHESNYTPLEVFTEENYTGTSQQYEIVTPHQDLGMFDNNIKSFKLKKGYMATFASNANGTGYSRVFVAQEADLEIPVLPAYLNGTTSFIRTMRWNEVTKKGWAGSGTAADATAATNSTWRYNWDTGAHTTPDVEYVPIRHNLYWPSFGPANTKAGYTHFLGYNEPDRPDQSNMTVETAISNWPAFMESGLRLGSPSTSDPFNVWLGNFMTEVEAKNYRVDYMALHCYWYKSATQWANDLQNIYNRYKRPIWITEWNIGANWTGNSFPDGPSIITDANATKHKNDLVAVLNVLDNADYVERYSIYNWVQDARAMILTINDDFRTRNPDFENYKWLETAPIISSSGSDYTVLTPAGEYYANNASKKAYNPNREYIPTWKPLVESLSDKLSSTYDSVEIKWTGNNNDLVNKYILERRLSGETEFSVFYETTDYTTLSTTDVIHTTAEYRMKVVGKDDIESAYSEILIFQQAVTPDAPADLTGEAVSSSIINLTWSAVSTAEGYDVKRATTVNGVYETVATNLVNTTYEDSGLTDNTTYYYKVSASNSGGESEDSSSIQVNTLELIVPIQVSNILLGSGDAQVKLEWDFMYDAQFYIKRSTSASGPFTTIATLDLDTTHYTDLTAVNGTTYYYKISTFNTAGEGAESEVLMSNPKLGQHAYYDFEENTGTVAHDQWGNYIGALASSASWTSSGNIGTAASFNGTSSSYIHLRDGIVEELNDFTISAWVKINNVANNSRIFDFGFNTGSWMAFVPYTNNRMKYKITYGGASSELIADYILPTSEWVHIVLVQEGDTGKIYADGSEIASGPVTLKPSGMGKTTANYLIKSQWSSDPYLNAAMDEFRIYNRALSVSEINTMMNSTLDVEETVLSSKSEYIFYSVNNALNAVHNGSEDVDYRLYTVAGQLVSEGKMASRGVTNIGVYPSGIYVVQLDESINETTSVKVLVK
ncbi:glycosyl hydrolase [Mariniflexile litorale]|uniref:Glycosyl hydrolase n=1 Tax=Mariniflexile litorale TaxID=3045158 RepID=A0AAU7EI94_9FLAO|nr:glycosyl hydrolase [Mariniflexile sp. KMM 9835]MDQ8210697.1 glycosyl hydrolase [Mariniflexile sp. KMM 9835]